MSKILQRLNNADRTVRLKSRLTVLGFKGGYHNPQTYDRAKKYQTQWHRQHRKATLLASYKYRQKIKRKFGSCGDQNAYLYRLENKQKNLRERKHIIDKYLNTKLLQPALFKAKEREG